MLVWGNLVCLLGSIIMVLIGLLKKKQQILGAQCVQFVILTIGNLLLGAVTGAVSNCVSIVRNLISMKREFTLPFKVAFTALQAAISFAVNDAGLIGWLPFIAACSFTWFLDCKSEIRIKGVIIFGQALWLIYDLYYQNYTTMAFDAFAIISNAVGVWMLLRDRGKNVAP